MHYFAIHLTDFQKLYSDSMLEQLNLCHELIIQHLFIHHFTYLVIFRSEQRLPNELMPKPFEVRV